MMRGVSAVHGLSSRVYLCYFREAKTLVLVSVSVPLNNPQRHQHAIHHINRISARYISSFKHSHTPSHLTHGQLSTLRGAHKKKRLRTQRRYDTAPQAQPERCARRPPNRLSAKPPLVCSRIGGLRRCLWSGRCGRPMHGCAAGRLWRRRHGVVTVTQAHAAAAVAAVPTSSAFSRSHSSTLGRYYDASQDRGLVGRGKYVGP